MNPLHKNAIKSSIFGTIILGLLIFLPAWTLDYWQGWAYIATFVAATTLITVSESCVA
jgi:fatty acid desaturase